MCEILGKTFIKVVYVCQCTFYIWDLGEIVREFGKDLVGSHGRGLVPTILDLLFLNVYLILVININAKVKNCSE
jgi:hypothetical protein